MFTFYFTIFVNIKCAMTTELLNVKSLEEFIKSKNVSIDFLNSNLRFLHHSLNYEMNRGELQLFSNFEYFSDSEYRINNFFELLTKSEGYLMSYRNIGQSKIDRISHFFARFNCYIGMFQGYTPATFKSLISVNLSINDLSENEKTIALLLLNDLVKTTEDDLELGKEIRRIFNVIK